MKKANAEAVTVKEFGLLIRGGDCQSLSVSSIPHSAFDWLLTNGQSTSGKARDLIRVKRHNRSIALQVVNFVGVLETPCGIRIEILPKISIESDDAESARCVLLKMLSTVESIKLEKFHQTQLKTLKQPLIEILIGQFLNETTRVVKRGLRSEYQRIHRESSYLKGQLNVSKQIRQRPGRQHFFHVSQDIYTPDRPENRLLHAALKQVMKWSRSTGNQRMARELLLVFNEIAISNDYTSEFRLWSTDRSLSHYRPIKPWCELILNHESPISMVGNNNGLSFLFPMEVLFEKYVAKKLSKQLNSPLKLIQQASSLSLTMHKEKKWFMLKPDLVIKNGQSIVNVLDTKWKLIDESLNTPKDKYQLSQSDFYQLYAYGEKYLNGVGELYLIYPKHERFTKPLEPFEFKPGLTLTVVPFDLDTGEIQSIVISP